MSQVINTNVMSLNAQRNLSRSSGALATSLARLSSGLRINSAKDDAAGLAISERFTTQIRGMNQAIRNANDGISLAQVAEGALQEVANNLQRIRELAVQARNATNSASDRAALDAEVQQRIAEIDRVAQQTEFNGLKVLDGSFTSQVFQVGANFGQTIAVDEIASATAKDLRLAEGQLSILEGTPMQDTLAAGALKINGVEIGAANSAKELAHAINSAGAGVVASAETTVRFDFDAENENLVDLDGTTDYIRINDVNIGAIIVGDAEAAQQAEMFAAAVNRVAAQTGVMASVNGGAVTLTAKDGRNIDIAINAGAESVGGVQSGTQRGSVVLRSTESIDIDADPTVLETLGLDVTQKTESYNSVNVLTAEQADIVLFVVDKALRVVNGTRADLGAVQNRFESVVANLSTAVENMSASRSRIIDADFAAETAALTRAQVLQQAGVAMLAQANMMPQNVLALLR